MGSMDEAQAVAREGAAVTLEATGLAVGGALSIATELSDYFRRSVEVGTTALKAMLAAETPEGALTTQADYLRNAQDLASAEAVRVGGLAFEVVRRSSAPVLAYANRFGR